MWPAQRDNPKKRHSSSIYPEPQSGSILILSVWTVLLLSLLVMGLGSRCVFSLNLTRRLDRELTASVVARGAVAHILKVLAMDSTPAYDGIQDVWTNNASLFEAQVLGGQSSFSIIQYAKKGPRQREWIYGLVDEESKLNLNTATAEMIVRLIVAVGGRKEAQAEVVADSILDWRDEDGNSRPQGAENFYYQGREDPYDAKNAPFENIEELLLIRGVNRALFHRMAPFVTVVSSGKINLNTASPTVLKSLGLSDSGVNGVVFYRWGEDNTEGTADDRTLPSVTAALEELKDYVEAPDLHWLARLSQEQDLLTTYSQNFRFSIEAQPDHSGGGILHLAGVIHRTGEIKAWREGTPGEILY